MKKKQLKPEPYMMNRELSWLKFNERVLNEAGNPRVPLAERLTFASIYQSNLDEFYMVRVGTLMDQMESSEVVRENKTNMTSKEQVKAIIDATRELDIKKAVIYEQLMGELEPQGIRIINFNKLSGKEGELLETYFDNEIAPYLSANIISKQQPFPFLQNKEIYAVALLATKGGKTKTAIIPCSNNVFKRLIDIPTRPGTFMLSEELILHFLPKLFKKYEIKEKSLLRITRNADIDTETIYDEDMDYRDAMENLVKQLGLRAKFTFEVQPPYYPAFDLGDQVPWFDQLKEIFREVTGEELKTDYSTGVSDNNRLVPDAGIPMICLGPKGYGVHQKDEWVDLKSVEQISKVYQKFLLLKK